MDHSAGDLWGKPQTRHALIEGSSIDFGHLVAQKPNPGLCNNDKSALQTIATTKGKFFGSCNTIICCLDWQWEQSL